MGHTLAILVFAAASLTDALEEIGAQYQRQSGVAVTFNFAASSTLARQIENGAPADLFLSADEASMDRVRTESRVSVVSNALVVVVPRDAPRRAWTSARDIALADPTSVPGGVYAREWLQSAGLWESLQSRVIPMENVRAALAAVASKNVDAAIVYRTDVTDRVRIAHAAPAHETPTISYPFAVLANAPHVEEARRFLAYLQSPQALAVFEKHGFTRASSQPLAPRSGERVAEGRVRGDVIRLTLATATISTILLLAPGLIVAWLLARLRFRGKSLVETVVALPLVMPPVATGLILLEACGWLQQRLALQVVFTWRAVVLAMLVMSFPLFVRAARVAFEEVDPRMEQIARTLGSSERRVFFTITLPLAMRGIVSGMLLAFARAVGEFGATILVAGNIPGRTSTLSLAIYNYVQLGRDADAFRLLAISVVIAFAAVWTAEVYLRRSHEPRPS